MCFPLLYFSVQSTSSDYKEIVSNFSIINFKFISISIKAPDLGAMGTKFEGDSNIFWREGLLGVE